MNLTTLHEQVLYSQVRVKTSKAGGSGTVIYSELAEDKEGIYHSYALTCHHVVDEAISVKNEWDSRVGRERKREFRQLVAVEFFDWSNVLHGNRPLNYSSDAEIVAYDNEHDMAILKLRTVKRAGYIARVMPAGEEKQIKIGSEVVAVGCALLHDPVLTAGIVTHFGDEIDGKLYWMSNANIIFGNSGGAVFARVGDNYEFIGIPSRIAIAGWSTPVMHMGYFSPISRVHEFFKEQTYQFLSPGSGATEKSCEEERKKIKEREERKLIIEAPSDVEIPG